MSPSGSKGQLQSQGHLHQETQSFCTLPSSNKCTCTFTLLREVPKVSMLRSNKIPFKKIPLQPSMCSLPGSLTLAGLLQRAKRNAKVNARGQQRHKREIGTNCESIQILLFWFTDIKNMVVGLLSVSEQLNLLEDCFLFLFQRDLFGAFKSYNGTSIQFI